MQSPGPAGETSLEHGRVGREHDHANGEAADEGGERDQADPAHQDGEGEIGRTGHGRHLTLKGKLPSVRCPSRATALQNTWYGPDGRGGRLTSSSGAVVRIDLGIALVDRCLARVLDPDGAEHGLDVAIEPDADGSRRRVQRRVRREDPSDRETRAPTRSVRDAA